ncbi:hypothetical protein LXL04_015636 [Taraxacum kok-saghyz]
MSSLRFSKTHKHQLHQTLWKPTVNKLSDSETEESNVFLDLEKSSYRLKTIVLFSHLPGSLGVFRFTQMEPSHNSFMINKKLAKEMWQNRPIPHWIRMRTDNTIRYNVKPRH